MSVQSRIAMGRGPVVPPARPAPVRAAAARAVAARMLRGLALRVIDADGSVVAEGVQGAPVITIHRDAFWDRLGRSAKIGFGEGYMAGDWSASDLEAVLRVFAESLDSLVPAPARRLRRIHEPRLGSHRRNTVERAAANIAHHYDLSNELFARFLDETMTYSCAIWEPGDTLAEAQIRKYEKLCTMLELTDHDHLLEIGTGWGGMAIHAAATHGCRVTSVTISAEQRALALERIAAAGLADRIEVLLCDYRKVQGLFSKIVSIEMFEAVGEDYWPTYFATCDRLLEPGGRMVLQTITMPHERFLATRNSFGWIHKYIFPGGLIPSHQAVERALATGSALRVTRTDQIGWHYVRTLAEWRRRFLDAGPEVEALGFTVEFRRMWEFYLAYCEAGFATGALGDEQLLLTRRPA